MNSLLCLWCVARAAAQLSCAAPAWHTVYDLDPSSGCPGEWQQYVVPSQERDVAGDGDTVLYFVMEVLCMGFSWALHLAQTGASHLWDQAVKRSEIVHSLVDGLPAPGLQKGHLASLVYVDNIQVAGLIHAAGIL